MLSPPSHLMVYSTTVLVVPPSHCDANDPPIGDFFLYYGCLEPSLPMWEASVKIPSLYLSLYHCSHGPAKWTCWHYSLPIAVLTAALKSLMPNQPATNLKTPTFDWTTSDQYDEFKLFYKSTKSWFHLQAIPDEWDDKGACLEYILNFLGTTDHWKWNKWTPPSVTTDDVATTKKSAKSFLDHLASQMEHRVLNILIGRHVNQAWRDPRWTGRSSESPCQ